MDKISIWSERRIRKGWLLTLKDKSGETVWTARATKLEIRRVHGENETLIRSSDAHVRSIPMDAAKKITHAR